MNNTLQKICSDKRRHITERKNAKTEGELREEASILSPPRGFQAALQKKADENKIGLIAEIKKASPSKGIIRADFDPVKIAVDYEEGGAACISVLTDEPYFQGKDEYLKQVRECSSLPLLRKDFILEPYQVVESAALGADCILLIMAAVDDEHAAKIEDRAFDLGLDVLIEVHDEADLERALKLNSKLIGINNRNLKTLDVDLKTTEELMKKVPEGYLLVSESGYFQRGDVERIHGQGICCFLIGEALMTAGDMEEAVKNFVSV